ncbi:MAG: response regulator transcription factor [Deltaproteobacteria bacterium]|nr:response regulator transcription factor [Deltaproteobacteria bacterium]
MPAPLDVLVVSDDPLARGGLLALLGADPTVTVLAASGTDDVDPTVIVDVILWDLGPSPDQAGEPETVGARPTLALVGDPAGARTARSAGATGILGRALDQEKLVAGLHAVAAGLVVVTSELADVALGEQREVDDAGLEPLTGREQEVLALLAEGLANRDVALALAISESTAKFHVRSILSKLGAATRTEAVVRAMRAGLLEL